MPRVKTPATGCCRSSVCISSRCCRCKADTYRALWHRARSGLATAAACRPLHSLMRVSLAQLQGEVDDELEERVTESLDQIHQRGWLHGDIEPAHGIFSSALQTQGPVWVDFRCASRIDNKRQITAEVDECRRIMLRSMCGPSTRSAALMCLSTCRLAWAGPMITGL